MRHFGISAIAVIFHALSLSACGQGDSAAPGSVGTVDANGTGGCGVGPCGPSAEDSPVGAPQDAATGGAARSTTALLVQGLDELPACEVATRRLLVYVAEDGLFRHCSEAGWQAINLEGKDGADGADGRDGVAVDNTWRDPVTGRLWLIGAYVNRAGAVCPEDWTPPTYLEVKAAYINGLGVALGVLNQADSIWTPTLEDGRFTYLHNSSVSGINQGVTTSAGEQHQLACFQEP